MPLNQINHGDVSWWKLSEGWSETRQHAKSKWIFANKSCIIPYGTYVVDIENGILRVETKKLLDLLNENFNIVYRIFREEILKEQKCQK